MSAFTIPTIYTAIDKYTKPLQKMSKGTQAFASKADAAVSRVDRTFNKLTPTLGAAGKQLFSFLSTVALAGALVSGATFTFDAIKESEKSFASLKAITGATTEQMVGFRSEVFDVAKETKKSSVEIAKAFELVGSAKPELLANADALGEVTKNAIILSKATGEDLDVSAQALAGTLNQFNLDATHSNRVINALAAGSQAGAAAVPLITEAIDKFGASAASANIMVEDSIGLVETLAEKNIKGAEAGTKIRNVLSAMATAKALPKEATSQLEKFGVNLDLISDKNVKFSDRLKELSKIGNDAVALTKVFGKENALAAEIILTNTEAVDKYTKAVTGQNTAFDQAAINSDTVSAKMDELTAAYVNVVTGTAATSVGMEALKAVLAFVADNMELLLGTLFAVVAGYAAMKTAILIARGSLFAYNVILGISAVIQGKSALALRANTIAFKAYTIAARVAGAAQMVLNAILTANPIGLVIAAIAAMIAVIALVVTKWNEWGAALTAVGAIFFPWLALGISMIQSLRRNWDMITKAFKEGGIIAGIKAIGVTILDALIMPLQQVLKLIAKLPGVGGFAQQAVDNIQKFRQDLGVNTTTDESGKPLVNSVVEQQNSLVEQTTNNIQKNQVELTIKDPGNQVENVSGSGAGELSLGDTFAFQ